MQTLCIKTKTPDEPDSWLCSRTPWSKGTSGGTNDPKGSYNMNYHGPLQGKKFITLTINFISEAAGCPSISPLASCCLRELCPSTNALICWHDKFSTEISNHTSNTILFFNKKTFASENMHLCIECSRRKPIKWVRELPLRRCPALIIL